MKLSTEEYRDYLFNKSIIDQQSILIDRFRLEVQCLRKALDCESRKVEAYQELFKRMRAITDEVLDANKRKDLQQERLDQTIREFAPNGDAL